MDFHPSDDKTKPLPTTSLQRKVLFTVPIVGGWPWDLTLSTTHNVLIIIQLINSIIDKN